MTMVYVLHVQMAIMGLRKEQESQQAGKHNNTQETSILPRQTFDFTSGDIV